MREKCDFRRGGGREYSFLGKYIPLNRHVRGHLRPPAREDQRLLQRGRQWTICPKVLLSIYPSIYLISIYYLSIYYPSIIYLSIYYPSTIYFSIYSIERINVYYNEAGSGQYVPLSIYLSIHLSIYSSIHLSIYLYI